MYKLYEKRKIKYKCIFVQILEIQPKIQITKFDKDPLFARSFLFYKNTKTHPYHLLVFLWCDIMTMFKK